RLAGRCELGARCLRCRRRSGTSTARGVPPSRRRGARMPRKLLVSACAGFLVASALFAVGQTGVGATPKRPHAAAVPAGLDHFLWYAASTAPGTVAFRPPGRVTLLTQFSSVPFAPKFVAVDLHCNPAFKVANGKKYPPKSPSWHLMCFGITGKQAPNTHIVIV